MTADDVDALLQQLPPPSPSPRLRERVLGDLERRVRRPRRVRRVAWGLALATALAGFAAVLVVILPGALPDQPGKGRSGPQEDWKFARMEWQVDTKGKEIVRTMLSFRQLFVETRDGTLMAMDRFTGKLEWTFREGDRALPDWPPVVAQGVAEEIQRLEEELRKVTGELDRVLQEKGNGPESQAFQRKRNELRERLRVCDYGDNVYLVSRQILSCKSRTTGAMKWNRRLDFAPSGPLCAIRNYVFVPEAAAGRVHVLDAEKNGALVVHFNSRAAAQANPTLGGPAFSDPALYFVAPDGTLHCYYVTNGKLIWIFQGGPGQIGAPSVHFLKVRGVTTRLLLFSVGQIVYAMDGDAGTLIWKFDCGAPLQETPTLVGDAVYARTTQGDLVALDAAAGTGNVRWTQSGCERFLFKGRTRSYVLGPKREIIAIDEPTGNVSGRFSAGTFTDFAGSSADGRLYAIRSGTVVCYKEQE